MVDYCQRSQSVFLDEFGKRKQNALQTQKNRPLLIMKKNLIAVAVLAIAIFGSQSVTWAQSSAPISQDQFYSGSVWFFSAGIDNSIAMGQDYPTATQSSSTYLTLGSPTVWDMSFDLSGPDATLTATTSFHSPTFNWQMSSPLDSAPLSLDIGGIFQGTNDESETISGISINGGAPVSGTFTVSSSEPFAALSITNGGVQIVSLDYTLTLDTPSGVDAYASDGHTPAMLNVVQIPVTESVPEPSSAAIAALGGLGLLFLNQKHRKRV